MAFGHICKVDGCENILGKTDGRYCGKHRARWTRHKDFHFVSPNWTQSKKGQPCLSPLGYYRIFVNGKRVLQHRHIMEQHLGRKLTKGERVHHKNGIKTDNRIENLELYESHSRHMKANHQDRWHNAYSAKTIAKVLKRIAEPGSTYPSCFCGLKTKARNLCDKHYQWAWRHKFT